MNNILAADIGGTKTLLQLSEFKSGQFKILHHKSFVSQDYKKFDDILKLFLQETDNKKIHNACFSIAGPVTDDGAIANVTNLPWLLERQTLKTIYSFNHLKLVNDFYAVAIGIDSLCAQELITIQAGHRAPQGTQLVLGAGTGLGVAHRIWNGEQYLVLSSEAGHAGFSPANEQQRQLLDFLSQHNEPISREQLLSGQGIVNIFQFLNQHGPTSHQNIEAAQISQAAQQGDKIASDSMSLFFEIFGSECGNLALACLPFGGIYIAGGIAAKNSSLLKNSHFTQAFAHKNKMQALLAQIPIYLISNESVGLQGARLLASQA